MSAAPLPAPIDDDTAAAQALDGLRFVCHSPRLRPYARMHDELRRQLLRLMLQSLDFDASEPPKCATFAAMAEHALRHCEHHLALEDALFHAPLRARAPRALLAVELDHEQLQQSLAGLRETLQQLRDARTPDEAEAVARELRLRLSLFVADGLAHMAEEESTLTRAWWAHFSDGEISACLEAAAQQAPHLLS